MRIRHWIWGLIALVWIPGTALGQSGFGADLLECASSGNGLLSVETAQIDKGKLEASLGTDWAYQLLGLRPYEGAEPEWIVKHRLSMRVAASYAPVESIRLAAGFTGMLVQEGLRINQVGARVPIQPAMGTSWLSAVWAVPGKQESPIHLAMATTLLLPTSPGRSLGGSDRVDVRILALFSARLWLFRSLVNLGIMSRARTRFADLVRDDGIVYRIGLEITDATWPLAGSLELVGETPLRAPFSSRLNEALEGIIGIKIKLLDEFGLHLGAGLGLVGSGAPTIRGLMMVRWAGSVEKMDGKLE